MQTIIVESDSTASDILRLNLEAFAGTDVITRHSSEEVIQILSIIPSINLIIMRAEIGKDPVAAKIDKFLKQKKLDIPCIVIGKEAALEYPHHKTVPDMENWEDIVQTAFSLLGISSDTIERKAKPKFIPVDIRFFLEISEPPCDVYIRIRQNSESFEYQYIKLIHSQDKFDQALIEKYEYQGLTEFYIEQDYHQYFATCVTNHLLKKIGRRDLTIDQRIMVNDSTYRMIMDKVNNLEIDSEAIELTHACINSMKETISQSDKLSELISRLFANKISYAYQKAHLSFIIATSILSRIERHSSDDLNVIGYAAFFSDINLKTQKQISILNYQNFETTDLDLADKSMVEFHARQISKMIEESEMFPEALVQVLKEHHGAKDGIGFPEEFPRTLHYLSYLFIVSDYFVSTLLHPRKPSDKAKIVEIISQELTSKNFKPYIDVLKGKLY